MFRRRTEFAVAWEPRPWWRVLSMRGWGTLSLAVFSSISFLGGLVFGQVFFVIGVRQHGKAWSADQVSTPVEFLVLMALNLALSAGLWWMFASWLRERRAKAAQPPAPSRRQEKP